MHLASIFFCSHQIQSSCWTVINIDGLTTARGDKDIVLAAVLKSGRQLQYATAEPEHGQ